jgi:hypothetical protein
MNLITSLYVALLFVLLTPGVLLRLPPKGPLLTAAIVHGLVFALVFHFTRKMVYRLSVDGFEGETAMEAGAAPEKKERIPGMMPGM